MRAPIVERREDRAMEGRRGRFAKSSGRGSAKSPARVKEDFDKE